MKKKTDNQPAPKKISGALKDTYERCGKSAYYRSKIDGEEYMGVKQGKGIVAIIGKKAYNTIGRAKFIFFNQNSIKYYAL